jgi:hypothetical protein
MRRGGVLQVDELDDALIGYEESPAWRHALLCQLRL